MSKSLNLIRKLIRESISEVSNSYNPQIGDLFNDLHYGGYYVLTDIKEHDVHGPIVILKNQNNSSQKQFKLEDFKKIAGRNDFSDDFQFLKVGENKTVNQDAIDKNRIDNLERTYAKDPEHAYHRTGTYYPTKGKDY